MDPPYSPPEVRFPWKFPESWFLSRGQISKRMSRNVRQGQIISVSILFTIKQSWKTIKYFVVVAEQNLVSSHPRLRGHGNGPRRAALCDRDPRMRKSSSTPAGGWRAYILVLLKGLLMYLKLDSSNYPHRRAGLVGRRVGGGGGAHYLLGFTVCLRVICEL